MVIANASAVGNGKASPVRRKTGWLVVLLTSIGIAVYFPGQYLMAGLQRAAATDTGLARTYAADPWFIQAAFYVHISTAGLALLVGPLQFSATLRRRASTVHRWIGRTYVGAVALGAVAAFIMSFVSSVALLGFFGFGSLAVLWFWTTYRGYRAIRTGDIPEHQSWMIRSFALTYAGVTLRLWLIVFLAALNIFAKNHLNSTQIFDYAYAPLPFLAWLPNIVTAELLIHHRELPGLRFTPSRPPVNNFGPPASGHEERLQTQ